MVHTMTGLFRWLPLVLLVLLGCSDATQITVEVTHLASPPDANVSVQVSRIGRGPTLIESAPTPVAWPVSLAITPKDDDLSGMIEAVVTVEVDGQSSTQRQQATFQSGSNVVMAFQFGGLDGPDGGPGDASVAQDAGIPRDAEPPRDATPPQDAAPLDATSPLDAAPGDAGAPGCIAFEDPRIPGMPLVVKRIAGHSHHIAERRHDWLAVTTDTELLVFARTAGDPPCFTSVQHVGTAPGTEWLSQLALGAAGTNLVVAVSHLRTDGTANVLAGFGPPGEIRALEPVIEDGVPSHLAVGGQDPDINPGLPFVAIARAGDLTIAHWDGNWRLGAPRGAIHMAGLHGGLVVAARSGTSSVAEAWEPSWNGSDTVTDSVSIGPTVRRVAGGNLTDGMPWFVGASGSSLVRYRRSDEGTWMSMGSLVLPRGLAGIQPHLLVANFNHWLAIVSAASPGGRLGAVWAPMSTGTLTETPIESTLNPGAQSVAVYPFGFAFLDGDRHIQMHVEDSP